MEPRNLTKGLIIKNEIDITEKEVDRMKRLRDWLIVKQGDEKIAIETAWKEFHMFDFNNTWAVGLRAKFISAIYDSIYEYLAQLDKDLIELNKEFDKL